MRKEIDGLSPGPVFAGDADWQCNACMNWSSDTFELYVVGYKKAADVLVQHVIETGRSQDILVFPICFLYRQYIELRLKEIISSGRNLLGEEGHFPPHHNLQNLWGCAADILKKAITVESKTSDSLALVAKVVAEFSDLDPDSFSFRYPVDKQRLKTLEGINYINLRRVHDYVDLFAQVMDGASTAISTYMDNRREAQSYNDVW